MFPDPPFNAPLLEEYPVVVCAPDSPLGPPHNFPCPCCRARDAVLDTNRGIFGPCYDCQSKGLFLIDSRSVRWWQLPKLWRWMKRERRIAAQNARTFYGDE